MTRKFEVGDRVRIIRCNDAPELVGHVATVISRLRKATDYVGVWRGHDLDVDGFGAQYKDLGTPCLPPSYLEPLYDGNELVSWESCLWQPKVTERAA